MDVPTLCPICNQLMTQVGKFLISPEHGQVSVEPKPISPLRIFLSYGHDSNEELVRMIKTDLEKCGHDVWLYKNENKFNVKVFFTFYSLRYEQMSTPALTGSEASRTSSHLTFMNFAQSGIILSPQNQNINDDWQYQVSIKFAETYEFKPKSVHPASIQWSDGVEHLQ